MTGIKELMQEIRKRPGDRAILRFVDEEGAHVITNSRFIADVERYARGLYKKFDGKTVGRHIAIAAPTCYEYVAAVFAGELVGAVMALINPIEEKSRIDYMIENSDADLVLAGREGIMAVAEAAGDGAPGLDSMMQDRTDDFSFLIFTSGTEGKMKGVMLSQRNILAAAGDVTGVFGAIAAARSDITFGSCYLMLPLFHVFGLSILFTGISGGVVMDLCVDFRQFYRDLQALDSEIVSCPPMAIKAFVSDIMRGRKYKWGKGLKFIFSGAASLPAEEQQAIVENGFFIAVGYGMTEIAGPVAINCFMDKFDSVGKISPRTQIEVRDKELFIKNDSVMLGYYKDPESTAEVLKEGWIATGDFGYIDEAGFVYLTGRKKNLIILSSGENVSPEELEAKIYAHKSVKECVVYAENGKIAAEVYAPDVTEDEMKQYVNGLNSEMPMYKAITVVKTRDSEFPKTSTGKIKRS